MSQIQKGTTYSTGNLVSAVSLNAHVDSAVLLPGAVTDQAAATVPATGDTLLLHSAADTALKKITVGNLLASPTAIGSTTPAAGTFTTLAATGLTAGSVPFAGSGGAISQDNANLFYDDTNNRLGIGTASPTKALDVATDAKISGLTVGKGAGSIAANTAVGSSALNANTSGYNNSAYGYQSLANNTSGILNSAYGHQSLLNNTGGHYNSAIGQASLLSNTTGSYNVAVGSSAMYNNTTGGQNIAIGSYACQNNTSGGANTAVGYGASSANSTGSNNTGVGLYALNANTADNNSAFGATALYRCTTGASNVAMGLAALYTLTTGGENSMLGSQAGRYITTGGANVGVGSGALRGATTANQNVAIGAAALYRVSTGGANVAVGQSALEFLSTGTGNTCLGQAAGYSATTGLNNTCIGYRSGDAITTGGKNTLLGKYNGNEGGLDIRTSSNNIVLSDGDGNPRQVINSSGSQRWPTYGAGALTTDASGNITAASDESIKSAIRPFVRGLDAIMGVSPILHGYTVESGLDQSRDDYAGFSAQNIRSVIPEAVGKMADSIIAAVKSEDGTILEEERVIEGKLTLSDRPVLAAAINAIKELSAAFEAYKATHP